MSHRTAPKRKRKIVDQMWRSQKKKTNGTRKFLLFSFPFPIRLSQHRRNPRPFPHLSSLNKLRDITREDLFWIFLLLRKLQLVLCVVLSIRFHPCCKLAPSRRRLQPAKIGHTSDVMEVKQRRTPVLYLVGSHLS